MKYLIALLCVSLTSTADAGCLFCQGRSTTVVRSYDAAPAYSTTYGYGLAMPSYRTYRVYRTVPMMVVAPQVGYAVPAPAAAADPDPVITYSDPVQSQAVYAVDDADVVRVRHKERHGRHRSKIKHSELSR